MGPNVDKLFLEVAGRPVVAHTWARFNHAAFIDEIVLVVRDTMQPAFAELAEQFHFKKPYRLALGGKERQDSVWNGLQALDAGAEVVAIQDGARPCTTEKLIAETIEAARETGAAVASQRSAGFARGFNRVGDQLFRRARTGAVLNRHNFR